MGAVLGEVLPFAVTVAISPVPIIAVILILLAPRAGGASAGFLAGWVAGIVAATVIFMFLSSAAGLSGGGEPSTPASWIKLVLGLLLVLLAARQWRSRPKPGTTAALPGWMKAIDKVTPGRAVALGVGLSAVNPKNLMMCVAAGVAIAQGDLGADGALGVLVIFTVLAASSVAVPVIAYATAAERMRGPLDGLKGWLEQNNATVMFVLLLVIGVVMIGKGLTGLAG